MKNMTLFMTAVALALTTFVPSHANANSIEITHPGVGFDRPMPFPGHRPNRPGMGRDYQEVRLNQRLVGQNILRVRQLLNIGPEDRGRRIQFVKLIANTDFGRGQATLLIDGRQVGTSQTVARGIGEYIFVLPENDNNVGDELRTLQIQLNGNFNVYALGVMFGDRWGGGHGRLQENILIQNRFIGQTLDLSRYIDLRRYAGMRVVGVSMIAQTAAGRGDATLCLSFGCSRIDNVGTYLQQYNFNVSGRDVVGMGLLHAWTLQLAGNFYIDSIQIQFAR